MNVIGKARGGLGRAWRAPMLVKAGAAGGLLAGLTLGVMVSAPVGIVVGISLGAVIGIVAGTVMDREDQRKAYRVRELDSIVPGPPEPEEAVPPSDVGAWLAEWMTPPPPQVG